MSEYVIDADTASRAAVVSAEGLEPRFAEVDFHLRDYAQGVRDALQWVTTGQVAPDLHVYVTRDPE